MKINIKTIGAVEREREREREREEALEAKKAFVCCVKIMNMGANFIH